MNHPDYNMKRRDNRWQTSADRGFKNRKDSGNRILYNMDKEKMNTK